jgi:hypothetical protein
VDRTSVLILLLIMIALSLWRLHRYLRLAMARPRSGIPAALGAPPVTPAKPGDAAAPAGLGAGPRGMDRVRSWLAAAALWLAANALLFFLWYLIPAMRALPTIWLLLGAVLANLYLLRRLRQRLAGG